MNTTEKIKAELDFLLNEYTKLHELVTKNSDVVGFGTSYQRWYSRSLKIVEALAKDRLEEFISYYLIDKKRKFVNASTYVVQDYVMGIGAPEDSYGESTFDHSNAAAIRLLNQAQILSSLKSRIDSVLQDVKGHLYAELQDAELAAAFQLFPISKRAAGSLGGVVLERHLQRVADNHSISIKKKNPTIADLNEPLKQAGVYDLTKWRRIQLLSDIRNMCSHQKSAEPTDDEVKELLNGVNSIIKSIF
jgi:hypothetical protein